MNEVALRVQAPFPVGLDRESRRPVTLEEAIRRPVTLADTATLSQQEWIALIRARWEAGEWLDMTFCDQVVDLSTAIAAIEAQDELGRMLLQVGQSAVAMVLEDLGPVGGART